MFITNEFSGAGRFVVGVHCFHTDWQTLPTRNVHKAPTRGPG